MNRHAASELAGRAALSQRTGGTGLGGKMHDATRLEREHDLVRACNHLLLPIQVKGRLGKARAIAHRPGLAVHAASSAGRSRTHRLLTHELRNERLKSSEPA